MTITLKENGSQLQINLKKNSRLEFNSMTVQRSCAVTGSSLIEAWILEVSLQLLKLLTNRDERRGSGQLISSK